MILKLIRRSQVQFARCSPAGPKPQAQGHRRGLRIRALPLFAGQFRFRRHSSRRTKVSPCPLGSSPIHHPYHKSNRARRDEDCGIEEDVAEEGLVGAEVEAGQYHHEELAQADPGSAVGDGLVANNTSRNAQPTTAEMIAVSPFFTPSFQSAKR